MNRWMGWMGCGVAAALLSTGTARADWQETVAGGTLDQASWSFGAEDFDELDTTDFTVTTSAGVIQLQADQPTNLLPPSNKINADGVRAVFGDVTAEAFTDATITADIASSSDNFYGVVLRGFDDGTDSGLYTFVINPYTNRAEIIRILNGNPQQIGTTGSLADADAYHLVFSAFGNVLTGQVYDATGTTLLGQSIVIDQEITLEDGLEVVIDTSIQGPGTAGVFAAWNFDRYVDTTIIDQENMQIILGENADAIDASFDNINVTAVPEPGTALLATLGLACVLHRRRRA